MSAHASHKSQCAAFQRSALRAEADSEDAKSKLAAAVSMRAEIMHIITAAGDAVSSQVRVGMQTHRTPHFECRPAYKTGAIPAHTPTSSQRGENGHDGSEASLDDDSTMNNGRNRTDHNRYHDGQLHATANVPLPVPELPGGEISRILGPLWRVFPVVLETFHEAQARMRLHPIIQT